MHEAKQLANWALLRADLIPMASRPWATALCWGTLIALATSSRSAPSAADMARTKRANANRCSSLSCLDCPKSINPASTWVLRQQHRSRA